MNIRPKDCMDFQKKLLERNIAVIKVDIIVVWFGLYICPTKPKPIYRAGQRKKMGAGVMGSRVVPEMLMSFLF